MLLGIKCFEGRKKKVRRNRFGFIGLVDRVRYSYLFIYFSGVDVELRILCLLIFYFIDSFCFKIRGIVFE